MRTKMTLVAVLFLLGSLTVPASASTLLGTMHFTVGNPQNSIPAPIGTFTYDGTFHDFQIYWNGLIFDVTAGANNPFVMPGACGTLTGTDAAIAALLMGCPGEQLINSVHPYWDAAPSGNSFNFHIAALAQGPGTGGFVYIDSTSTSGTVLVPTVDTSGYVIVTAVVTPEPATAVSMLIAMAFLGRRRVVQGIRKAPR